MQVFDYTPQDFIALYLKHGRRPDGRNRNPAKPTVDVCGLLALEFGYRRQSLDGHVLDFFEQLRLANRIQATRPELIAFGTGYCNAYLLGINRALFNQNICRAMDNDLELEYLHGKAVAEFLLTVKW